MASTLMKETKFDKGNKKLNSTLMNNLGWLSVVCLAGIYLFWGFYTPQVKDQTIWETLLSSGVSMIISLSISNLLSAQGLMRGGQVKDVVEMKLAHRASVIAANEYAEYADEWATEENKQALITARKHIMMSAGLKYSNFFNAEGYYTDLEFEIPENTASKHAKQRYIDKQKALDKALSIKITPVTLARLSAETSVDLDPNKLDKEPLEFQKAKSMRSIWTKVFTVALFAKLTLKVIENVNVAESLFNGILQLSIYLFFGIFSMYNSYNYMTGTYVGNLIKKKTLLTKLVVFGKKKQGGQNGTINRLIPQENTDVNNRPI